MLHVRISMLAAGERACLQAWMGVYGVLPEIKSGVLNAPDNIQQFAGWRERVCVSMSTVSTPEK